MNKSTLVEHVAQELATSRLRASVLVDAVLDGIKEGLRRDQNVTLTGFGTLIFCQRLTQFAHPVAQGIHCFGLLIDCFGQITLAHGSLGCISFWG